MQRITRRTFTAGLGATAVTAALPAVSADVGLEPFEVLGKGDVGFVPMHFDDIAAGDICRKARYPDKVYVVERIGQEFLGEPAIEVTQTFIDDQSVPWAKHAEDD